MGGGGHTSSVQPAKTYVQAVAPDPEETAEAPVVDGVSQSVEERGKKRRGTAALSINLNVGGGGGTSGGSPVNIPY